MDDRIDTLERPPAIKGGRPPVSVPTTSHEKRRFLTAQMREFLSEFRGKPVFYHPTQGNAGDSVIHIGIYQAFRRAGLPMKMRYERSNIERRHAVSRGRRQPRADLQGIP